MEQGHTDRIVSCYGAGKFKVNKKYSRPHETVYTKDGDKYHWLVVERKDPGSVEVQQTDGHGKIPKRHAVTAWDTYESCGGTVRWTCAERLRAEGRGTVRFGMDEIKTIRQAAGNDTIFQLPKSIEGRLSALSGEIRKGLLATAAAHGVLEQKLSVLKRMAEIRERRGNLETSGEMRQKKAERDAAAL